MPTHFDIIAVLCRISCSWSSSCCIVCILCARKKSFTCAYVAAIFLFIHLHSGIKTGVHFYLTTWVKTLWSSLSLKQNLPQITNIETWRSTIFISFLLLLAQRCVCCCLTISARHRPEFLEFKAEQPLDKGEGNLDDTITVKSAVLLVLTKKPFFFYQQSTSRQRAVPWVGSTTHL